MSAFYESAPAAYWLGLFWSLLGMAMSAISTTRLDVRPVSAVANSLIKRGLAYGSILWLVLGVSATIAGQLSGPTGTFPKDGLRSGLFSMAASPESTALL